MENVTSIYELFSGPMGSIVTRVLVLHDSRLEPNGWCVVESLWV